MVRAPPDMLMRFSRSLFNTLFIFSVVRSLRPLRSLMPLTPMVLAMKTWKRARTSSSLVSRGYPVACEHCVLGHVHYSPWADLPWPGRAAKYQRLPGWMPSVGLLQCGGRGASMRSAGHPRCPGSRSRSGVYGNFGAVRRGSPAWSSTQAMSRSPMLSIS